MVHGSTSGLYDGSQSTQTHCSKESTNRSQTYLGSLSRWMMAVRVRNTAALISYTAATLLTQHSPHRTTPSYHDVYIFDLQHLHQFFHQSIIYQGVHNLRGSHRVHYIGIRGVNIDLRRGTTQFILLGEGYNTEGGGGGPHRLHTSGSNKP